MVPYTHKLVKPLCELYVFNDYPLDQLMLDTDAKSRFSDRFNEIQGTDLTSDEICGALLFIRKNKATTGGLPRIGRSCRGPNI